MFEWFRSLYVVVARFKNVYGISKHVPAQLSTDEVMTLIRERSTPSCSFAVTSHYVVMAHWPAVIKPMKLLVRFLLPAVHTAVYLNNLHERLSSTKNATDPIGCSAARWASSC